MWDAFLNRPCQSCEGLSTPKNHNKQKLDINSVEYQSYIRRDVLQKYSMPNREGKKPSKLRPVYLRVATPKGEGKCPCAPTKSDKCLGYCEPVKQSLKPKPPPQKVAEPEEGAKEPKPCRRHPVLILRRKRVVKLPPEQLEKPGKLGQFSLYWVSATTSISEHFT